VLAAIVRRSFRHVKCRGLCPGQPRESWDLGEVIDAGSSRGGAAGRPVPRSLVQEVDTVGDGRELEQVKMLRVQPCDCRRVACRRCNERVRSERRAWLKHETSSWPRRIMLTLTVDLAGTVTGRPWRSPQEVYDHVCERRLVSELMRQSMPNARWIGVLEFQGNGAPHWHLVVDEWVALAHVRMLWRDRWKIGARIDVQDEKSEGGFGAYLSKYISKAQEAPSWVKERERVRFVSASRSVQSFSEFSRGHEVVGEPVRGTPRAKWSPQTMGQAMSKCGSTSVVFDGKGYVCTLRCGVRPVLRASLAAGMVTGRHLRWRACGWHRPGPECEKWSPSYVCPDGVRAVFIEARWLKLCASWLVSCSRARQARSNPVCGDENGPSVARRSHPHTGFERAFVHDSRVVSGVM